MSQVEPVIEVGLLPETDVVGLRLDGEFVADDGRTLPAGEYRIERDGLGVRCSAPRPSVERAICLRPTDPETGRFSLETTIGVRFHWQQREVQTFAGAVRVIPTGEGRLTVINDVPLETYLTSVICSEMSATSPADLVKAHAVVSRSWLIAQLASRRAGRDVAALPATRSELIRWTDREGHATFDVCADDHCQRYHGVDRIKAPTARDAITATRGQVLVFGGQVCDARYAKACGGITEDFRAAWGDAAVPYLVALADSPAGDMPNPPLADEQAFRRFLDAPSDAYCNCSDETILREVLTPHDLATADFFRWTVRLSAGEASELVEQKLGLGLGRILALEPVERGLSGRLVRLALVGEERRVVIGKELEIRRALSPSHLYSSAFAVDPEGPPDRPDAFVLRGAGWGHGVGLCQIGAAVMAARGTRYEEILAHYYPGATLRRGYA